MYTYEKIIQDLKSRDLYRKEKTLSSMQDVCVQYEERSLHLMGSNNYLSLNGHPRLQAICHEVLDTFGTGSGGSRLTTGSSDWHKKLEDQISAFKETEDSLIFSSGYAANLGVITSLAHKETHVFSDKDNHASIVDGLLLSGCQLTRYKHLNYKDLERRLSQSTSHHKIIITDTVFSMDGSTADLRVLSKLAKAYSALLIVDDAHGLGVLGPKGQGLGHEQNMVQSIDLTIGSLSKAIPGSGGYVTGSKLLVDIIRNKARSYIFSTAPPAHMMALAYEAINMIKEGDHRRQALAEKTSYFIDKLRAAGFKIPDQMTPIIPIPIGPSDLTLQVQDALLEDGIYIPGIRPPTVKKNHAQLRASINYNHSHDQLDYICSRIIHHCKVYQVI